MDPEEFVRDELRAVRMRVRAAGRHLAAFTNDDGATCDWPSELLAAETAIRSRACLSLALPVARIAERFELTPSEDRILWTLIAHELCPIARQLIRGVSTEQSADPSTDSLRRIVYGADCTIRVWREVAEDGPLRKYGFIEATGGGGEVPDHRQTWKVARRVLALVHGETGVDIGELANSNTPSHTRLEDLEIGGDAAECIERAFDRGGLVLVHGRVGHGRRSVLNAIAAKRGLAVLEVMGRTIANEREAARRQLRAVARECRLFDLVPMVRDLDALSGTTAIPDRIDLVEDELSGLVLATASCAVARRWKKAPATIELGPIMGAQRVRLWSRAIPQARSGDCDLLATMYPLAPALIEVAGKAALDNAGSGPMTPEHIEAGLRSVLDDRLAGLATRVTVTQTWDDIVLPDDQATAIIELLARIRERRRVYEEWGFADKLGKGLGVSALFSGPPGTGKTMAAGLVARSLHAELYQVDLSKIVSKWIGETEKNLAALFDAAEAGHAILLFDEADALFGKRTDIRSSNDRYANQEVNFLLQRLESYAGIVILTTNHETAIDEAFRRRLSVHVHFPMPEVEERQRLWKAMIPESAPRSGDLDLHSLATTFVMSGGYIRNAVLRAAFLAADERGSIDGSRLRRAAQLEYESLGKIVAANPLTH